MQINRHLIIESVLGVLALAFAFLFLFNIGSSTNTIKIHDGLSVAQSSYALNLNKGLNDSLKNKSPYSPHQTDFTYSLDSKFIHVMSSRGYKPQQSYQKWLRGFHFSDVTDQRPFSLQGHPGYLYVTGGKSFVQLTLVAMIQSQIYMISVGEPQPSSESKLLPTLNNVIKSMKLNPATTYTPTPKFTQACAKAKKALYGYFKLHHKVTPELNSAFNKACAPGATNLNANG
jgi:hypothetical protein